MTSKAVRSGAWLYGRNIVTSLINLGVMAILARQLTPADFGLVALATVLLRFLVILAETGVADFVIYDNKEGREVRTQAAFWMNLVISIIILLIGLLLMPLVLNFYDMPGLSVVLVFIGIRYLFAQVTIIPQSLIRKSLEFDKFVLISSTIEILSSLISVVMALTGWGVLSLVLPSLVLELPQAIVFMRVTHWTPKFPLHVNHWRPIFKYSSHVIGATLATTIGQEGDTLIIGKTMTGKELGLYNMAWNLANMIPRNLVGPISAISLPAFSALSNNLEQLRSVYNRTLRIAGTVSFPLLIGLFVLADLFVLTIYGPQWQASILPLRILIIFAIRHSIGSPANTIFNAVGRPDINAKLGFIVIPFYLTSVLIGSNYGIVGVATAVTIVRVIFGMIRLQISARMVNETLIGSLKGLSQSFLAAFFMGLGVALAKPVMGVTLVPNYLQLIALTLFGGLIYLALIWLFFRQPLMDLYDVIYAFSNPIGNRLRRFVSYRGT